MGGRRDIRGRESAHTHATKHARQQRQTAARRAKEKQRRSHNKRMQKRGGR